MITKGMKAAGAVLLCGGLCCFLAACACGKGNKAVAQTSCCGEMRASEFTQESPSLVLDVTPRNAVAGECVATVFIPPKFETVSERVCVKEASERVEVFPAKYEWVEEKVCVKDASTRLIEEPAEYATQTRTVIANPGSTDWVREDTSNCKANSGQKVKDVFCLVSQPATERSIATQTLKKPATVKEVLIPAEYQTVRHQKLVAPETTKCIVIPAEFDNITRTVKVADARIEWQKVVCEGKLSAEKKNEIKNALASAGFRTDPSNGEFTERDWTALTQYQETNRLGTGALTYETMKRLGVSLQ